MGAIVGSVLIKSAHTDAMINATLNEPHETLTTTWVAFAGHVRRLSLPCSNVAHLSEQGPRRVCFECGTIGDKCTVSSWFVLHSILESDPVSCTCFIRMGFITSGKRSSTSARGRREGRRRTRRWERFDVCRRRATIQKCYTI